MLSLYTLKSASDASKYYQSGDYYTRGGAKELSVWMGKGAEILGLKGSVDFNVFKGLLEGRLPNGEVMSNVKKGEYHIPGYDLTFSAPKSVSILALVAGNKEVIEAHREALRNTLKYLETTYAGCRNKNNGVVSIERTGNYTLAAFEHGDSRAGDPNLHTHWVLMNLTQKENGDWRTIYADEFYTHVLLMGRVYDSHLAHALMQRGFELEIKENGNFEIKGVPKDLIDFYSKRHEAIQDWLKERDLSGSKAAEVANFMTRGAKVHDNPAKRQERWIEELKTQGARLEQLNTIAEKAKERGPITLKDPEAIAEQAVNSALKHLSERQQAFSFQEVVKTAKLISLLPVNEGNLLKSIEQKISDKGLIYLENKLLTIPEIYHLEQNSIDRMKQGKKGVNNIYPKWMASLSTTFVNDVKEREALKALLSSKDRQMAIIANSKLMLNKTIKDYIALSISHGYYPRVLTQNNTSIDGIRKKLNTERVSTLEGFLLACEERTLKRGAPSHVLETLGRKAKAFEAKDIWIVNGDISASQVSRLGAFAETLGARIVYTQLKPIRALEPLKKEGMMEVKVLASKNNIAHLQNQEYLVKQIETLEKYHHIQEQDNTEQRQQLAIEKYLAIKEQERLVVTLSHTEKHILNTLVRQDLKQRGTLQGQGGLLTILKPLYLSTEEKSQSHLYQPGDIIRFNRSFVNGSIVKDSYFEVNAVHLDKGVVELKGENGSVLWSIAEEKTPLKHAELFRQEQRELQEGDIIRWTRTIKNEQAKEYDKIKGESAIITAIHKNMASVRLRNGVEVVLKNKELKQQHWDYGYVIHLKEVAENKDVVVTLQHQQIDAKNIELLSALVESSKSMRVVCDTVAVLKKTVENGGYKGLAQESKTEIPYKRAEALENYQTLATQPLFNRLQSEFLKVNQLNPEFTAANNSIASMPITPKFQVACDVVDKVCIYHSERDAVLKLEQLKKEVIEVGTFLAPPTELNKAVALALERGWLAKVGKDEQGQDLVTTKHTLLMEQMCIEKMKAGQGQLSPILAKNSPQIQEVRNHQRLTQGQKEAIELILTTPDRMVAVQGIAGAGKTTALKEIKRLCQSNHYTMVLANTASAKNQAKNASGIESQTIMQFLIRMETKIAKDLEKAKKDFGNKPLFIVDESSLASTKDVFRLETIIEKLDAKVALVGDFKQQGSFGAGFSFHDFLAYEINKAVMKENVRLSDSTAFTAMKQAYAGDMKGTLNTLKNRIEEIPNKEDALNRIVKAYFEHSAKNKEAPLIITPLNKDRRAVNEAIREQLKEEGILDKKGLMIEVFVPTNKRDIEKSDALSYKSKDVIRFNVDNPRLSIKAGDYARILNIDPKHQRLNLQIKGKKEFYWSPKNLDKPSSIEIYHRREREFSKNDTIVFKRNDQGKGIFNGDKATISKLENGIADITLANGTIITLDLTQEQNQHLDHGYALTTYMAQGRDVELVIAYGDGPMPYLIKASKLKAGDITVLGKEHLPKGEHSKVVQVIKTQKTQSKIENNGKKLKTVKIQLTLKDRDGNIYTVNAHELKPTKKNNKNHLELLKTSGNNQWAYFPPFEKRRTQELPLSTSQQSFLIQITRGNKLILVVPYIDDFQKTLEAHQQLKRSALSYVDSKWKQLNEKVNQLVHNISGIAAFEKIKRGKSKNVFDHEKASKDAFRSAQSPQPVKNKGFTSTSNSKNNFIDKDELEFKLNRDMLGYASQWRGSPSSVTGREARWGNKGSFSLILSGAKAGIWNNWETGKKGKGLISLYMEVYSVLFKDAVQELGKIVGFSPEQSNSSKKIRVPPEEKAMNMKQQEVLEQQDRQTRIKDALALYHKAVPIKGTLAEKYLKEHRGITEELPNDFRFLKADKHLNTKKYVPALVAPYRDKKGKIVGIVRIYLNKDGSKYTDLYTDQKGKEVKATPKANRGVSSYGSVVIQEGVTPKTLWIAEGIETALSVAEAIPNQTVVASVTAGQIANVPLDPKTQKVIICADNDPASSETKHSIIKAVESFLAQGVKVAIALPPEIPAGMKKYDFNDLLKDRGVEAVQKCLAQMVEIKDASLLKTGERRVQTDLNKICSENEATQVFRREISSSKPKKLDSTLAETVRHHQIEISKEIKLVKNQKILEEKGFER